MQWISIIVYLLLSASGLVFFKMGAETGFKVSIANGVFSFRVGGLSFLGIICYGCSFILYLGLVSKYNLSYLVPVTTGIMYVIILIASYVFFQEQITITHIIGCILVLAGVTLINIKK